MVVLSNYSMKENPEAIELEEQLVRTREQMYELADVLGLNHHLTIQKSQELDVLLNKINKLKLSETEQDW